SPLQMRMLFQNLISNAIKFRDPARRLCVTIAGRTEETTGKAVFEISDTGIGIAPEHQQKVFGLFQRLHLHDDYPGSGLGLALCHRIVSNHGGEVGVTSVPGAGSTFTFTLDPRT
ncbi:MAG: ATP-binding protein, partial [Paracoccaceae bacterium]|nr:ATP-binding protein [Paracoccaceae bacterium]